MTVASLWKALDRAGCGRAIGIDELLAHHRPRDFKITPWNYNRVRNNLHETRPALAVDLSIWICEALTSSAMAEHHANPALYLVYTRTLKLLNLGIRLVVVVEGECRNDDRPHRRGGSGSPFWIACAACESLLQRQLGVPVVRAPADGEALCALLNQRGIVDGVISRDGDCLLYGAKVVYTKFSVENLEQSRVMRYDAEDLRVIVDDDVDEKLSAKMTSARHGSIETFQLSREDLIAFAIITGSDLAGNGIDKIGCRKAIRFLRKCRMDNPLKKENAAIDELRSWARVARITKKNSTNLKNYEVEVEEVESSDKITHCSCCLHPGNKRTHQKHGCEECGTAPSELCLKASPSGIFRRSLRAKVIAMEPTFDPDSIIAKYQKPNDNKIPLSLAKYTATKLPLPSPRLDLVESSSLVVKGQARESSKVYMRLSVARLMARISLFVDSKERDQSESDPICQGIKKQTTQSGEPHYEVSWKIKLTCSNNDDEYFEFVSFEPQGLFRRCYAEVVIAFEIKGPEMQSQGNAEQMRRKAFLESFLSQRSGKPDGKLTNPRTKGRQNKARADFFEKTQNEKEDNEDQKDISFKASAPKGIHVGRSFTMNLREDHFDDCSSLGASDSIYDPTPSTLIMKQRSRSPEQQRQNNEPVKPQLKQQVVTTIAVEKSKASKALPKLDMLERLRATKSCPPVPKDRSKQHSPSKDEECARCENGKRKVDKNQCQISPFHKPITKSTLSLDTRLDNGFRFLKSSKVCPESKTKTTPNHGDSITEERYRQLLPTPKVLFAFDDEMCQDVCVRNLNASEVYSESLAQDEDMVKQSWQEPVVDIMSHNFEPSTLLMQPRKEYQSLPQQSCEVIEKTKQKTMVPVGILKQSMNRHTKTDRRLQGYVSPRYQTAFAETCQGETYNRCMRPKLVQTGRDDHNSYQELWHQDDQTMAKVWRGLDYSMTPERRKSFLQHDDTETRQGAPCDQLLSVEAVHRARGYNAHSDLPMSQHQDDRALKRMWRSPDFFKAPKKQCLFQSSIQCCCCQSAHHQSQRVRFCEETKSSRFIMPLIQKRRKQDYQTACFGEQCGPVSSNDEQYWDLFEISLSGHNSSHLTTARQSIRKLNYFHSRNPSEEGTFDVESWNYFSPYKASGLDMELEYQRARTMVLLPSPMG